MTVVGLTSPYVYVLGAVYAAWIVPELVDDARGSEGGPDLDANSRVVLSVAVGAGFAVAFWLAFRAPAWATFGGLAVPAFWTGVLATLAGVALRWYSIRTLGDAFDRSVTVRDDQSVVARGPYAVVRHPAYTGGFVALLGVALSLGTWPGVAAVAAGVSAGYAYRIRVEERALRRELDGYDDYCERVPDRLVPGVY
ncbi:isoprenylcysteine carboxylmethyltransferase family protein [Salarchaeum sp. JOR-1]|uniref:methyltransferase family protein n=1 Tax=Salarchaeum sp. JOR-1 TaxID=2599399 RepID=UPI001198A88A|nr:isoprenylcysteine carboxylmethyltransferase family protein [Salarchaeum sp. JOR-1]QDX40949.1 isoprenylcysteine carboxylmethyltransferase family protein [Salarchaeum sp. JOR-1]